MGTFLENVNLDVYQALDTWYMKFINEFSFIISEPILIMLKEKVQVHKVDFINFNDIPMQPSTSTSSKRKTFCHWVNYL